MSNRSLESDDAVEQIICGEIIMKNMTTGDESYSANMKAASSAAAGTTSKIKKVRRKNTNVENKERKKATDPSKCRVKNKKNSKNIKKIRNESCPKLEKNVKKKESFHTSKIVQPAKAEHHQLYLSPPREQCTNETIKSEIPPTCLSFNPSEGTAPPNRPRLSSSQTESTVPPTAPILQRNTARAQFLFPGAVHIPGFSARRGTVFSHYGDDNSYCPTSSEELSSSMSLAPTNNAEAILVNAQLVVQSDDQDLEASSASVEYHHSSPAPPIVKAEVMESDSARKSTFHDLSRNRSVQILFFALLLVIIGLSVGMVFGFGSNGNGETPILIMESSDNEFDD